MNAVIDPCYTVAQVAEGLQTTEEKVLDLIHRGALIASNIGKGDRRPRWRIPESEYARYLLRTRLEQAAKTKPATTPKKNYFRS